MTRFKTTTLTAATAALLFTGSAFASTTLAAPAAGNAPYFDSAVVSGQLQRGAVEAQAAAHHPAAGESSMRAQGQPADSAVASGQLQRSAVEAQAAAHHPAAGQFSARAQAQPAA